MEQDEGEQIPLVLDEAAVQAYISELEAELEREIKGSSKANDINNQRIIKADTRIAELEAENEAIREDVVAERATRHEAQAERDRYRRALEDAMHTLEWYGGHNGAGGGAAVHAAVKARQALEEK